MSKATRATKMLEQSGIAFTVHSYDYDPDAERIGMQAAEALGEPPERVLETLMALVDGKPACVIAPSDRTVSMKKPRPRKLPTAIEKQSMAHGFVFINGGQRGLQVRLNPRDAAMLLNAIVAPLVA